MKSHHYFCQKPHLLVWSAVLFLVCCIPLSSAQLQNHREISKLPFQASFRMRSSDPMFYRLDLANAPKGLDLIISVVPEHGSDSPKLFVSNNKEFPQKMNDADYSSIATSRNVILINNKDFKDTSTKLFIGLVCGNDWCGARISVEWTKEIKTTANGEKAIESSEILNEARSAIVRLTIPKEEDIERIVIHADAIATSRKELPPLEVLISQGTSIPFTNNAENIQRRSSWFEGDTIVIDKDSSLFCTDCTYTLSLKFTEPSSINIQAQTYKENTQVSGETRLDGVQKGKENFYRFTGRENSKEEDFVLSVKVHQGKVTVFIDCDIQPQASASYYWHYKVADSQDITLSHNVRSHCNSENYFIMVQGEESSVYSLQANYKKSNQLFMGKATPVRGIISSKEKITHEILLPLFIAEEITLDLRYKQPLELNIINCRFSTDCPGVLPADRQQKITNYYGFDDHLSSEKITEYHSEEIASGGRLIKINPQKSECYPIVIQDQIFSKEPVPVCAYLVTLSNQQPSPIEYTLTAEYKGPNLLTIGEPIFDIVTKQSSIYYVLSVPSQKESIESIQIQLTKFSGDLDVFVSKSNKNPKQQSDSDVKFSYEGLLIIKDISEAYYIGVHGLETSSFSLSAVIQMKYKVSEDSAFTLAPGKPQKGVLLPKDHYQAQFYKLLLNQDEDWQGMLRITVNSFTGRARIVVNNNGEFPTAEKNMWEDNSHDLKINSIDFDFKKQGLYYVGIFVDMTAHDANLIADLTYYITYSIVDSLPNPVHTFLSPNTPFFGAIKKGESNYFEALLPSEQFPLTIYKQSDEGKISLYISTDPNNKYPSQGSNTFTTAKDSITLEACEATTQVCPVCITVSSAEEETSSYSLSLSSAQSSVIALENDRQIESNIPINESPATFYYHAIPSKHSVVTVNCTGREVIIYAKRTKVSIESHEKPNIGFVNEKSAEFTSEDHKGVTYISVPPLTDSDITLVVVSVYFREISQEESATFTILASSQITQLYTGTSYTGFVEKDHYIYFMVNVMRSECTLLVSLTNLEHEGDADLVISYGSKSSRPTTSHYQFAYLSDKKTEVIEISKTDLPSQDSMSGNWIFGVYGYTASSFKLTVVYEDQKMVALQPGVPVEMSLKESSFIYFKFLQGSNPRNLQFNLTRFSGKLNLYMTSINLNEDLASNLPDQIHHKWQISRVASQSSLTIPMQDFQACVSCIYLLNVEALSSTKFSLVVNELGHIAPIQNGLQYSGRLKPQKSAVFVFAGSNRTREAQLNVETKGSELNIMGSHNPTINLTNYLWKETLTPNQENQIISLKKSAENLIAIWDGGKQVDSQRDSYYFLLHNPTNTDLDYSFKMTAESAKIFTGERIEQTYDLEPYETSYYVHNSSSVFHLYADILIFALHSDGEDVQSKMESGFAKEGVKGQFWHRDSLEGPAHGAFFRKVGAGMKSNSTHAIRGEIFFSGADRGKYMLEIVNPWEFPVKYRVYMRTAQEDPHNLSPQTEDIVRPDDTNLYPVHFSNPGKWYLWAYSCDTAADFFIKNGDLETAMVTIPKGGSHLYKEAATHGNRDLYMSANPTCNYLGDKGKVVIYSSSFSHEKEEFKDSEVKEDQLEVKVAYQYEADDKSQVTVEFKPAEFKDPGLTDNIVYKIWLCPDISQRSREVPLCSSTEYCVLSSVKFPINHKEPVKVDIQGINYGMYYVNVIAAVEHEGELIKAVQPYVVGYVSVKDSIFWKIFKAFIWIEVLIVMIFVCFFRVMRTQRQNQGVELQNVENNKKGYNVLEDEASVENPKREPSECSVIEINEE